MASVDALQLCAVALLRPLVSPRAYFQRATLAHASLRAQRNDASFLRSVFLRPSEACVSEACISEACISEACVSEACVTEASHAINYDT